MSRPCALREFSASHYLWDNWVVFDPRAARFHRYLLAAPRTLAPDDRHAHAHIVAATSGCGERWDAVREALGPGLAGAPDGLATWTGVTLIRDGKFVLLYTAVGRGQGTPQTIALATSDDGALFEKRPEPVLAPSGEHGYDLGDDDGVVMAWRDPHVARDPRTGTWHMVFACKRAGPAPRGAVGHAVALDDDLTRWQLRPPLPLQVSCLQAEVPALIFSKDAVYCSVSTKRAEHDDAAGSGSSWWIFTAPTVDGPWRSTTSRPLIEPGERVYGARPFAGPSGLGVAAFFTADHPKPLSPAPLAALSLSPTPQLDRRAWRAISASDAATTAGQ